MYQVNEIFNSLQGEGFWVGTPATFIRLQGCTVGCKWCDTKYTWGKGGTKMTLEAIDMSLWECKHVIITGGEPTAHNLDGLIKFLWERGKWVQLETSGQQWLKGTRIPDWITVSPKPPLDFKVAHPYYDRAHEVKWVVDEDLHFNKVIEETKKYLERTQEDIPWTILMPEGSPPTADTLDKAYLFANGLVAEGLPRVRAIDRQQYRFGIP